MIFLQKNHLCSLTGNLIIRERRIYTCYIFVFHRQIRTMFHLICHQIHLPFDLLAISVIQIYKLGKYYHLIIILNY